MTPRSDVAVIIAVYNGERFLAEAIRSALAQTVAPFEIIVVDDGSTDGSAEIARRFDVRYYYQPNAGVGAARNAGLEMATGSFVAFLDADDRWCLEKLERQLAALKACPAASYALCQHVAVFDPDVGVPSWYRGQAGGQPEPSFVPSAWLVRRSALDTIGWFDPSLRHGDDTDWLARARDAGLEHVMVDEPLLVRRIHGSNLTGEPDLHTDLLSVLRRSVRRKAASPRQGAPHDTG